jgi:NAD-dependent dihydropyrimidine dehydrogenase PreA subunit
MGLNGRIDGIIHQNVIASTTIFMHRLSPIGPGILLTRPQVLLPAFQELWNNREGSRLAFTITDQCGGCGLCKKMCPVSP